MTCLDLLVDSLAMILAVFMIAGLWKVIQLLGKSIQNDEAWRKRQEQQERPRPLDLYEYSEQKIKELEAQKHLAEKKAKRAK
jgi:hypothetical protein